MGFPKDYLILWKNVSVLDFAIYNMTSTQILHVNMQICLVEKITPKVIDLLPCRTITSFVPPSNLMLTLFKKEKNRNTPLNPYKYPFIQMLLEATLLSHLFLQ